MITLDTLTSSSSIATWNETDYQDELTFLSSDAIATESRQTESRESENPKWKVCIGKMEEIWKDSSQLEEPRPNRETIQAAVGWLYRIKSLNPSDPPTCILPEPAGGIIIEWRGNDAQGVEHITELTLYNGENAELTLFRDGRVTFMRSTSKLPPKWRRN